MSPSASSTRAGGSLAALLVVATLLVTAATATYLMQSGQSSPAAGLTVPIDALYGIAVDAEGAAAGNDGALAIFQAQLQQLKDAAAANPGAPFTRDARFSRLISN